MANEISIKSRNELILENILGANNVLPTPVSLTETLLTCWLNGDNYTDEIYDPSRNTSALLAIVNGTTYDVTPTCEIEALLAAIANGTDPDPIYLPPKSRIGALLYEIYNAGGYDVNNWADVQKIAQKKLTDKYLTIGDTLTVKYDGYNTVVQYVAKNKDIPNGSANGDVLTFQFQKIFASRRGYDTNIWRDSANRTFCNTDVYNDLDESVKTVIGEVVKTTSAGIEGEKIDTVDKVFLLSKTEAYGGKELGIAEGKAYDYFANGSSSPTPTPSADDIRIKIRGSNPDTWWLRSPGGTNEEKVRDVTGTGQISTLTVNVNSGGVCPAFCIY